MYDAIDSRSPRILTYGLTPPKSSWEPERIQRTAKAQAARIGDLADEVGLDGVVVYDLQDESARTDADRPFPFVEPVDPVGYALDQLGEDPRAASVPKVVYRCVARLDADVLGDSLDRLAGARAATVFVGAASGDQPRRTSMRDAYALHAERRPEVPLGGVLIGERHRRNRDEHTRVLRKVDGGVRFFVTQAVYATTPTLDVLSDLERACTAADRPIPPVLVTLTPCGSERTLRFLRWLGVAVPWWLENQLLDAEDTLATSVDLCTQILQALRDFAVPRGIPLGCNVESVSLNRDEIDASVELARRAREILGHP